MTAEQDKEKAIAAWVDACRAESWEARELASKALALFATDDLFDQFVDTVRDTHDFAERNAALVWLERHASDRIFQLFDSLNEGEARLHLINLAGRIADARSAKLMRPYLNDKDPNVVQATIESLGLTGNGVALDWLRPFLDLENPWNAFPAIKAMGNIGDPRAILWLEEALEDDFLAPAVIEALGLIGGKKSVALVVKHWNRFEDAESREAAVRMLGDLWERGDEGLSGTLALPPLDRAQNSRLENWTFALEDLALAKGAYWLLAQNEPVRAARRYEILSGHEEWLSLASAVAGLVGEHINLENFAGSASAISRQAGLTIASSVGRLDAVAPLIVNDSEVHLRLELARKLANDETSEITDVYLLEFLWDEHEAVRMVAREHFKARNPQKVIEMGDALVQAASPEVMVELLQAFPGLASTGIQSKMMHILSASNLEKDPDSVLAALRSLDAVSWFSEVPVLYDRADTPMRIRLLGTAAQPVSEEIAQWLASLFAEAQDPVRVALAELMHLSGIHQDAFWQAVFDSSPDRDLMGVAIHVLPQLDNDGMWQKARSFCAGADAILRRELFLSLVQGGCASDDDYERAIADEHWSVRCAAIVLMPDELFSADIANRLLEDENLLVKQEAAQRARQVWGRSVGKILGRDKEPVVAALADKKMDAPW